MNLQKTFIRNTKWAGVKNSPFMVVILSSDKVARPFSNLKKINNG